MNKKQIKAVIFDCFGVLVCGTLDVFREKYLTEKTEAERQEFTDLSHASDCGMISYDDFAKRAADLAGISVEEANQTFRDTPKNMILIDFIREKLKPEYKIGLLSNIGSGRLSRVLNENDLSIFDDQVLSFDVKMAKPDAEIYELAAMNLGVELNECVFVDDNENNIIAAEKLGMRGIVYTDFAKFRNELDKILN